MLATTRRLTLLSATLLLATACSGPGPKTDLPPMPDSDVADGSKGEPNPAAEPEVSAAASPADADADGVPDAEDRCTDTQPDQPVADTGCALFAGAIPDLDFAPGSDELDVTAQASLDQLVSSLQEYPDVVIQLAGHTDNRGRADNNLELSKRRVMAVARYLVLQGVEPDRLRPVGYGESQPAVSNSTESGRQQNRRIEVSVFSE